MTAHHVPQLGRPNRDASQGNPVERSVSRRQCRNRGPPDVASSTDPRSRAAGCELTQILETKTDEGSQEMRPRAQTRIGSSPSSPGRCCVCPKGSSSTAPTWTWRPGRTKP